MSTLSYPAPARTTIFNSLAASKTSLSTMSERMITAFAWATADKSSDFSVYFSNTSTECPPSTISFLIASNASFAKGFSTATILYCVGAMVILGSINSGLTNDNTILNIKAILDGVISIVLTSIYGIGVIFSAISVTIYQGIFYLFASQIKGYLNPQAISELNAVGGILVLAIGINMTFKKDIKTANMLPAIFIPLIVSIFS